MVEQYIESDIIEFMFLSSRQILAAIKRKNILIEPFNATQLSGASYTFTISDKIKRLTNFKSINNKIIAEYKESRIPKSGYKLKSGQFVVLYTKEHVNLKGKYICVLSTRSPLAQIGLDVLKGSSFAEPDTNNSFALEVTNQGPLTILINPGMKIVKGFFCPFLP